MDTTSSSDSDAPTHSDKGSGTNLDGMKTTVPVPVTYLLVFLAMAFYGFSFISTKTVIGTYGPVAIIFIRLCISAPILFVADRLMNGRTPVAKEDRWYFIALAFFEPFLYFLAETYGLQWVSASAAAIIIGTIPVVTPIFAFAFLRERLSVACFIGLVVSFAGVALIVMVDRRAPDFSLLGVGLLFVAVVSAVMFSVFSRKIPARYSAVTIVKYQSLLGAVFLLPLFLILEVRETVTVPFRPELWGHLLYLAVFPSTLAFIFLNHGIRTLGANKANATINSVPVFTAVFAFFVLGEQFPPVKIAGILVAILGVSLAQYRRSMFRRAGGVERGEGEVERTSIVSEEGPPGAVLFWQDVPIRPGTIMRVDIRDYDVRDDEGRRMTVTWEILDLRERDSTDEYFEPSTGKTYPMQRVMKNRRLGRKYREGAIIQIPSCAHYLVIREFHDGEEALLRCFSVDMLGLIRDAEVIVGGDRQAAVCDGEKSLR